MVKRLITTQRCLIWALIVLAVASVFYTIASYWSQPNNVQLFYNPDIVGDPFIIHMLIYNHDSYHNWYLTNAFFLFPDMTLIFLISLFTKLIYPIYPVFAFIQVSAFIILTMSLFKVTVGNKKGAIVGLISTLLFLLLLIYVNNFSVLYTYYDYLNTILSPTFHFGSFIVGIGCAIILMKLLQQQKIYLFFLLSFLVIITGISDPLLHFYFTFPAIGLVFLLGVFRYLNVKQTVSMLSWFIGMFVAWYIIYNYVPLPFQKIKMQLTFPWEHISNFINTAIAFKNFSGVNTIVYFLDLAFFIFAPISIIWSHIKSRIHLIDYFILFQFLLIICGILGLLTTESKFVSGITVIPIRYMIPLVISPAFLGLPLLLYKYISQFTFAQGQENLLFGLLFIFIILFSLNHRDKFIPHNFFNYYPQTIQCFDEHAKSLELHNGIVVGQWGEQNVYNAYNRSGARFIMVGKLNNRMKPYLWFSTRQIYMAKRFDFIMMANDNNLKKNKQEMLKLFGIPTTRFICHWRNNIGPKLIFFVYKNAAMKNISFAKYISPA